MESGSQSTANLKISSFGLAMIRRFEGCVLRIYPDISGHPTIGVGHRITGEWQPDMTWTMEQAMDRLAVDVGDASKCIRDHVLVPLSQPQFDALVSFVFNIGRTNFILSTMLILLNKKEYAQAAHQFIVWVRPSELQPRRNFERGVFLYGTDD